MERSPIKKDLENNFFVESLKKRLSAKGLSGVELSRIKIQGERLCTAQHLSRVLNYKQSAGRKFRNKFADWLGLSVYEMINEGQSLLAGNTQNTENFPPNRLRRSTDLALSELSMDELSSTLSLYASEFHKKHIEIIAELQNRAKKEREKENDYSLYRQVLDQSPAAINILRVPDKMIVYRNEAHIKAEGKDLLEKACGEECILDDAVYDKVLSSRANVTQITEAKNGEIYSVLAWPIYNPKGQLTCVANVARNITHRYHEAGVAETTAKRYEAVLSRAARFVYIYDENKRMIYTNATRRGGLLEHASEEDLQTFQSVAFYIKQFVTSEEWQKAVDVVQSAFKDKKEGSYQARLADGRLLLSEVHPIIEEGEFRGVAVLSHTVAG